LPTLDESPDKGKPVPDMGEVQKPVSRPRWWRQLFIWSGFAFGIYLLFTGDTVERVIGAAFVSGGLLMGGAFGWTLWKVLRKRD
jgi:hypothetical protein